MNNDPLKIKTDLSKLSVHILSKVLFPIGWSVDIEKSELVPNMDLDDFSKYLFDESIKAKSFFSNQAQVGKYDSLKIILIDLKSQIEEIEAAAPGMLWPIITENNVEIDLVFHPYLGKQYLNLKADFLESLIKYIYQLLSTNDEVSKKTIITNGLTHRHEAIIFKYKSEAKYIPKAYKRTDIVREFGKGREKAYDTVNELSDVFKPITAKELEIIIPHLADFPNAQKAAINDLDKLS